MVRRFLGGGDVLTKAERVARKQRYSDPLSWRPRARRIRSEPFAPRIQLRGAFLRRRLFAYRCIQVAKLSGCVCAAVLD